MGCKTEKASELSSPLTRVPRLLAQPVRLRHVREVPASQRGTGLAEPDWAFPKGTSGGSLRRKSTQRDVMGRSARVAPSLVGTTSLAGH